MTSRLKVTSKGQQVTIGREVLAELGVSPASIEAFIGCLKLDGIRPPSIDEINEIAAEGWAGLR